MTEFTFSWTCADCKTQNEKPLTKIEAAFCGALKVAASVRCRKCGGHEIKASSHEIPDLNDDEVLEVWLSDRKLYFLEQDEELALATLQARRLVDLLSSDATPRQRRGLLFRGLLYKTFDCRFENADDARVAKNYLRERREEWLKAKRIPFRIRRGILAALDER